MLKTEQVVNKIIEALEDNKAHRIVKIDLRKIENCFCSFFVICHGTSGTHIAGLTDAVEEKVREDLDERPFHIEGSSIMGILSYTFLKKNCATIINWKISGQMHRSPK